MGWLFYPDWCVTSDYGFLLARSAVAADISGEHVDPVLVRVSIPPHVQRGVAPPTIENVSFSGTLTDTDGP